MGGRKRAESDKDFWMVKITKNLEEPILPNFSYWLTHIFYVFAIKLGPFIVDTKFFIWYKHSSLTVRIVEWEKKIM